MKFIETIAVTQNYCNTYNFNNAWPEVCKEPEMAKEMIDLHALSRPDLFTEPALRLGGKELSYLEELKLNLLQQLENQHQHDNLNNTSNIDNNNNPVSIDN